MKTKPNISLQGNNGGDYINLKELDKGLVLLEVGSCGVIRINSVVPVEFLTALIAESLLEHKSIEGVIDSFGWDDKFKRELKTKIREI